MSQDSGPIGRPLTSTVKPDEHYGGADHPGNVSDLEILMSPFAEDCVVEASGGAKVCGMRCQGYREVKEAFA